MKFSEKLYFLRKKRALSQEQLAERLDVSRQAISKWEGGTAFPESEKLIAISEFFEISLDDLLKDERDINDRAVPCVRRPDFFLMIVLCITGALSCVGVFLWMILAPQSAEDLAASSMITLDGRAILLLAGGCLLAVGIVLFIKTKRRYTK